MPTTAPAERRRFRRPIDLTRTNRTGVRCTRVSCTCVSGTRFSGTGIDRTGINRTGINRTRVNRTGINRTGINRTGINRTRVSRTRASAIQRFSGRVFRTRLALSASSFVVAGCFSPAAPFPFPRPGLGERRIGALLQHVELVQQLIGHVGDVRVNAVAVARPAGVDLGAPGALGGPLPAVHPDRQADRIPGTRRLVSRSCPWPPPCSFGLLGLLIGLLFRFPPSLGSRSFPSIFTSRSDRLLNPFPFSGYAPLATRENPPAISVSLYQFATRSN